MRIPLTKPFLYGKMYVYTNACAKFELFRAFWDFMRLSCAEYVLLQSEKLFCVITHFIN